MDTRTVDDLLGHLRTLSHAENEAPRVLIGIAGAPGAGKSTLADALCRRLDNAVVVPQDGFHVASSALDSDQRRRRGALDTFDIGGFLSLLRRLRNDCEDLVWAPAFTRDTEEPLGSAIPIPRAARIILVEGNYLLSDAEGWRDIRRLLTEAWYLDLDPDVRRQRLIARHVQSGKSAADAVRWSNGSDEHNARTVEPTRARADLAFRLVPARMDV